MAIKRNTIAYFKEQVSETVAVVPASVTDGFVSIESPDITTGQREILESDLLSTSIGMRKPQLGFETAQCSVVTELRSHGDTGAVPTQPDFGILLESSIGTPNISVADTVQALPAPSTTEVTIGTEGNIKQHDFVIQDNTTDGKVGRFVKSLKLAIIAGINDKIDFNEGGPEYNATLTAGVYTHGSSSVVGSIGAHIKTQMEAEAGTGTITVTAILQADGSYKYTIANSTPTFQLLIATGANTADNFLKLNLGFGVADLTGSTSYTGATAIWGNRLVWNVATTTAPTSADPLYASVNYKPINQAHKHFTSGFYNGNSASDGYFEQVIGCLVSSLGFDITTGQIAKMNFDIQGLKSDRTALTASSFNPSYESVQGLVAFCVDMYIGSTLIDANAFTLTVEDEIVEKQSFKECSGKIGSNIRSRSISGTVNPFADGSTTYYDALNALTDYDLMVVIGKKDADGFMIGQTVGIYLPQVMITQTKTSDIDDNIIEDINFSAHAGVDGTKRDVVISFS
jgi:hypothetical protein